MRVLVDGLDTVIEGEVIGGEMLDGVSGQYDLEAAFTVRCDDGAGPRSAGCRRKQGNVLLKKE